MKFVGDDKDFWIEHVSGNTFYVYVFTYSNIEENGRWFVSDSSDETISY